MDKTKMLACIVGATLGGSVGYILGYFMGYNIGEEAGATNAHMMWIESLCEAYNVGVDDLIKTKKN